MNYMIERSFMEIGPGEFNSRSIPGVSCPPYIIANAAARRVVEGATLELPEGYSKGVLETVLWVTGWVDKDIHVSGRQALELRQIGTNLLNLNAEGKIEPPFTRDELDSINHLVAIVAPLEQTLSSPIQTQ